MSMLKYSGILLGAILSANCYATPDFGPVDMGAFYQSLPDVNVSDPLGKVVKVEKIDTSII